MTWHLAAATVLTPAAQGRLDLDRPVTSYLRSWSPTDFPAPRYRYVEAAAAGWCTTADDLARLAGWLASDDARAVAMRAPAEGMDGRYGLGVERWGRDVVGRPGVNRGFHADLWADPAAGVGLVVPTDGDAGGKAADAIRDAGNEAA